ncbi:hypothetical protein CANARDRAFT_27845 [[Candida] arabinofermentans NRRL YB-2248]|uniref:ferric-chelate reductase (NADPH) n=1 Tax=[Candida] arabinofermentans NRRL YB-2248 TaxID=983967 RepID=A0A1E4T203_9ASCO|nr:hypothetical protein CANARDRAFT_27845 [[Candida] arabinofermentans NRRL YB-2248]
MLGNIFEKRDITVYGDIHCIADMGTVEYTALKKASQTATAWADMALYAKYQLYFFAVIIFLAALKKYYFGNYDVDRGFRSNKPTVIEKISSLNRYISYRKLPTKICSIIGLPSSVGNLLVIAAIIIYSVTYCFAPHPWFRACAGFGSPPLAIRAGMISTAFVPFIFIMSGKTNIISALTGISYEKLNVYHQLASVLCLFFAWVHTVPFYMQAAKEGGAARLHEKYSSEPMWVNGMPPLIFLTFLWLGSLYVVRRYWYEAFIQLHWIMAVGFYISLFYHVYGMLNADKYMIATIVIWFTQLFYRLVVKGYMRPGKKLSRSQAASIEILSTSEGSESFEMIIQNDFAMRWNPGQHIFVRILNNRLVENHPFSVIPSFKSGNTGDMKLIIRSFNGITKSLYNVVADGSSKDLRVLVDGPYGGVDRDVRMFSNLYLVASGSGITTCIPFVTQYSRLITDTTAELQSIRLDWIIKRQADIDWIQEELEFINSEYGFLLQNGLLTINIYCANDSERNIELSENGSFSKTEEQGLDSDGYMKDISLLYFRPEVKTMIRTFKLGEKNCFISSGSDALKEQVGNSVARLQTSIFAGRGDVKEVYLHTESFSI